MTGITDEHESRLAKLRALREMGVDPYPPRFRRTHSTAQALAAFDQDGEGSEVTVAGRLVGIRIMGKSAFAHIQDGDGRLQLYFRLDTLGEKEYEFFKRYFDLGDFVGATGTLFRTHTGEVTVHVRSFQMLAKALRPMPEKWHGIRDVEIRYRQRYLDLLANEEARRILLTRTRIVAALRRYLDERGFIEVETPILQPIYGGAAARPFVTYHNELKANFYLRIADELYLKRLIIGGLDKVYEIGKDFRNEGISTRHNPEFTQLEVYVAYADYHDMMALVEDMWATAAREVLGSTQITYQGHVIDLTPPWQRITMRQAILDATGIDIETANDLVALQAEVRERNLVLEPQPSYGKLVDELFAEYVEPRLIAPTIVTEYPLDISPLAKMKPGSDKVVERFEFFIAGLELGNAYSELNDPLDQRERFAAQAHDRDLGDEEAHPMDEDFLLALEHGMPPTGGLGFGIERMVMIFTDQTSIREVIAFPQLRARE